MSGRLVPTGRPQMLAVADIIAATESLPDHGKGEKLWRLPKRVRRYQATKCVVLQFN